MASFGDYVDQAAAEVLSRNEILMAAPGSSRISSFYPTPAESTNTIAQAVCNSGQLSVKANSKSFGGSSDFQISTSNILDCPVLSMRIVVPALVGADNLGEEENVFFGPFCQGWGFDAIESFEVSYANSNVSNLRMDGNAMKEYSLYQCETEEERQQLLQAAGRYKVGHRQDELVFEAAVPISFLNWRSAGGVKEGFPIDGRALNGPIQFQFRFRKLEQFMGAYLSVYPYDSTAPGTTTTRASNPPPNGKFPTAFSDLTMTFRTYQLMDGAFSVSKALMANPGMIYSLPSLWLNSYTYTVNMSGGKGSIQLNSAPAGMIQAILINVKPVAKTKFTATSGTSHQYEFERLGYDLVEIPGLPNVEGSRIASVPRYNSAPINYLRLRYSGQTIFLAETESQLSLLYKQIYGNDLKTFVPACNSARSVLASTVNATTSGFSANTARVSVVAGDCTNGPDQSKLFLEQQTYNIPLMHDGKRVFDQKGFENLPHYSGSTLTLDFGIEDRPRAMYSNNDANCGVPSNRATLATAATVPLPDKPTEGNGGAYRSLRSGDVNGGANMTQYVTGDPTAAAAAAALTNTCAKYGTTFFDGPSGESSAVVTITYVVSALLQSTNGIVELQL